MVPQVQCGSWSINVKNLITIFNNRVIAVTPVTAENLETTRQYFLKKGMIVIQADAYVGDHYNPKTGKFTRDENPGMLLMSGQFVKPDTNWRISKLAFKNRFPRAKWIAAKQAATTNPELEDFFESFDLSQFIDLSDKQVIDSVNMFTTSAVPEECRLSADEANAILTTIPTSAEFA